MIANRNDILAQYYRLWIPIFKNSDSNNTLLIRITSGEYVDLSYSLNLASSVDDEIGVFSTLSPRGEMQKFVIKYSAAYIGAGNISYPSMLKIESDNETIDGEEYEFTIEYKYGMNKLIHDYKLSRSHNQIIPIFANPEIAGFKYTAIYQNDGLQLYANSISGIPTTWLVNNISYTGDCIITPFGMNDFSTIVVQNSETKLYYKTKPYSIDALANETSIVVTTHPSLNDWTIGIDLVGTERAYNLTPFPKNNIESGMSCTFANLENLTYPYTPTIAVDYRLEYDNGVVIPIANDEVTITGLFKAGKVSLGKAIVCKATIVRDIKPVSVNVNPNNNNAGTYLLYTDAIVQGTRQSRGNIVTVIESNIEPYVTITNGSISKSIPVKLVSLEKGFSDLLRYSTNYPSIAIDANWNVIKGNITTLTKFSDVISFKEATDILTLYNNDLITYTTSIRDISLNSTFNEPLTLTVSTSSGKNTILTTSTTVSYPTLIDDVYSILVTSASKKQTIVVIKTDLLESIYSSMILNNRLGKAQAVWYTEFLALYSLIKFNIDLYYRNFDAAILSEIVELLTKYTKLYVKQF